MYNESGWKAKGHSTAEWEQVKSQHWIKLSRQTYRQTDRQMASLSFFLAFFLAFFLLEEIMCFVQHGKGDRGDRGYGMEW